MTSISMGVDGYSSEVQFGPYYHFNVSLMSSLYMLVHSSYDVQGTKQYLFLANSPFLTLWSSIMFSFLPS